MKLHAYAALSLKGRQRLCRRVLGEGWAVAEAAEAADVSVRCAREWVGRYRAEGEARAAGPIVVARVDPTPHLRAAGAGDRDSVGFWTMLTL